MFTSLSYYLSIWSVNQTHGTDLSPILLLSSWIYFKDVYSAIQAILINYKYYDLKLYDNLSEFGCWCHRVVWFGKVLKDHPVPTPLPWAGTIFTKAGCLKPHPTWPWTLLVGNHRIHTTKHVHEHSTHSTSFSPELAYFQKI